VLGDLARGINESSAVVGQQILLYWALDKRLPFICNPSDLAPWVLIEKQIIALKDHHSCGGRNTDVQWYRVLLWMIETRHPEIS
jgi:hypothetical protein